MNRSTYLEPWPCSRCVGQGWDWTPVIVAGELAPLCGLCLAEEADRARHPGQVRVPLDPRDPWSPMVWRRAS